MVATPLEAWHGCRFGGGKDLEMKTLARQAVVVGAVLLVAGMAVIPPISKVAAGGAFETGRGFPPPDVRHVSPAAEAKILTVDVPAGFQRAVPSREQSRSEGGRRVRMLVSAYCPCPRCCGVHACGVTASGHSVFTNQGKFVAADPSIPFGTCISIPGYHRGEPVPVLDRGGGIRGDRLDVYFPTHAQAQQWGARWLDVTVGGSSRSR